MKKEEKDVIYLCKCAVNNTIPEKDIVSSMNFEDVYRFASRHMIASLVGFALQSVGIKYLAFDEAVYNSLRKTVILNHEKDLVFQKLDEAKIWHMSLKGTVLKNWYPQFGMRESADCDVLFDKQREEDVRKIMINLGYSVESYGEGHHDVYYKKPVTNMQMHVDLFGVGFENRLNNYFKNVKDRLIHRNGYEYEFSPEDFYIYMLAHNYRDFSTRGTGFRSIVDTYVFLNKYNNLLNWDYIDSEIGKLGVEEYENQNRSLAVNLFSGYDLTVDNERMLEYLLSSGVYGTLDNTVKNGIRSYGGGLLGKIKYIFSRIFLPIDVVKHSFPFFYKYRFFLPALPVYRAIKGFFFNRENLKRELQNLSK